MVLQIYIVRKTYFLTQACQIIIITLAIQLAYLNLLSPETLKWNIRLFYVIGFSARLCYCLLLRRYYAKFYDICIIKYILWKEIMPLFEK